MCIPNLFGSSSSSSSDKAAKQAAALQAQHDAAITKGTAAIDGQFNQFDDNFYNQRQQDYEDWANPQVDQQYDDAKKQLVYSLSRGGNINSSTGAEQTADLTGQYDDQRRSVVDSARAAADSTRTDVANERGDLISELNATYDPNAALSDAETQASNLQSAPAYASLGDLFTLPAALAANAVTAARLNGPATGGTTLFQSPAAGASTRVVA